MGMLLTSPIIDQRIRIRGVQARHVAIDISVSDRHTIWKNKIFSGISDYQI